MLLVKFPLTTKNYVSLKHCDPDILPLPIPIPFPLIPRLLDLSVSVFVRSERLEPDEHYQIMSDVSITTEQNPVA